MKVIVKVVIEIDNKIKKRLTVFGIACIVSMFTKWFGSARNIWYNNTYESYNNYFSCVFICWYLDK